MEVAVEKGKDGLTLSLVPPVCWGEVELTLFRRLLETLALLLALALAADASRLCDVLGSRRMMRIVGRIGGRGLSAVPLGSPASAIVSARLGSRLPKNEVD